MDENMQTSSGSVGATSSAVDTGSSSVSTPSVDNSTTTQTQNNSGGFSSPQSEPTHESEQKSVYSANGGFKMVFDEKTGRNKVMVVRPEQPKAQEQESTDNTVGLLPRLDAPIQPPVQPQSPMPQQQVQAYSLPELTAAMELNAVDESRIPQEYQEAYFKLKSARQANSESPVGQEEASAEQSQAVEAQRFYNRIDTMAHERAMQEVGITQDEIDVGEYTDDEEVIAKYRAYQVAKENNKAIIFNDVNRVREQESQQRQDIENAKQQIISFAQAMKQKEPNFDAIDKLMISRVNSMPYAEAQKIVPLLQKVQNGTITTADLPALQKYFDDTRLMFYSKKTGVGVAPQVVKPNYTETPGNGMDMQPRSTPLSVLGKLGYRDKIKAIGQMFRRPEE